LTAQLPGKRWSDARPPDLQCDDSEQKNKGALDHIVTITAPLLTVAPGSKAFRLVLEHNLTANTARNTAVVELSMKAESLPLEPPLATQIVRTALEFTALDYFHALEPAALEAYEAIWNAGSQEVSSTHAAEVEAALLQVAGELQEQPAGTLHRAWAVERFKSLTAKLVTAAEPRPFPEISSTAALPAGMGDAEKCVLKSGWKDGNSFSRPLLTRLAQQGDPTSTRTPAAK